MTLVIRGLATAVPAYRLTQSEAERVAHVLCCRGPDHRAGVSAIYRHSGIASRHILFDAQVVRDVLEGTRLSGSPFLPNGEEHDPGPTTAERMKVYEENALPLAERAARQALAESGLSPAEITHLITVSCTGFAAPGVDVGLMKRLGLSPDAERTHVGFMGCHGALNGLRVARGYAGADPSACVLLCAVELCSLHYHYPFNPKRLVANTLFGDGAAALVGVSDRHPKAGQPGPGRWSCVGSGSHLFPDSEYAMTWHIGDHGFDMTLSTKVPNLIAANLRPWLDGWLAKNGLSLAEVRSWAVHPGGPRVLSSINETLGLREEATAVSREVLGQYGNMSSPTVLFLLERLRQANAPRPCVALGFGPGLVVEAAIFG